MKNNYTEHVVFTESLYDDYRALLPEYRRREWELNLYRMEMGRNAIAGSDEELEEAYGKCLNVYFLKGGRIYPDIPKPDASPEEKRNWFHRQVDSALLGKELLERTRA